MKYRGDRSGDYRHEAGTGVVGKVVGPGYGGQWFVITEATYDPETDTTYAAAHQIRRPEAALEESAS